MVLTNTMYRPGRTGIWTSFPGTSFLTMSIEEDWNCTSQCPGRGSIVFLKTGSRWGGNMQMERTMRD